MRKLLLASAAAVGATFAVAGGAQAQPVKPTVPGTLVVHINGYLQFESAATARPSTASIRQPARTS